MKRNGIIFVALLLVIGVTSCKKVKEPESADFSWYFIDDYNSYFLDLSKADSKKNPATIELSDKICFVANDNTANSYVVWTGEAGHNYEERELSDELLKDTVNNVALKASGIALSTKDGKGRYTKTYTFTNISSADSPYQMYCTARNYDYESGEYKEIKAGPYPISVIDTQTDLWDVNDPYNDNAGLSYILSFKMGKKKIRGTDGSYEIDFEKNGIIINYADNLDATNTEIRFKANNCIPFVDPNNGTITYNVKTTSYTWSGVDLSSPVTIKLASQSAVSGDYFSSYADKWTTEDGVDSKGNITYPNDESQILKPEYTKDYEFVAVPFTKTN